MASILDFLGLAGGDSPDQDEQAQQQKANPSFSERLMAQIPGGQYLSPQQSHGALGMALLNAGAGMLQASAPRRWDMPGPSFADAMGAGFQGFGQGLNQSAQMGMAAGATQAQMALRGADAQAKIMDVMLKRRALIAQAKWASGDRSPETFMAAFPEKSGDIAAALPKSMGEKGMVQDQNGNWTQAPGVAQTDYSKKFNDTMAEKGLMIGPSGQVMPVPGFAQSEAHAAGLKAAAEAWNKIYDVRPGGALVAPPGAAIPGQGQPQQQSGSPGTNNPGNIMGQDGRPLAYPSMDAGAKAMSDALVKHADNGVTTLVGLTSKWAPPDDGKNPALRGNNPIAYARFLSQQLGGYPIDAPIDLRNTEFRAALMQSMARLEHGKDGYLPQDVAARAAAGQQAQEQPKGQQTQGGWNVVAQGQSPADVKNAEGVGSDIRKGLSDAHAAADATRDAFYSFKQISDLLDGLDTGKWSEKKLELAKGLRAIRMGDDTINSITGLDNSAQAKAEAALKLQNHLALKFRNPNSGEGMPGQVSGPAREFLTNMTAGLTTTPQGRALIVQAMKKIADHADAVAQLWEDHASTPDGMKDLSIYKKVRELKNLQQNPEQFFGPDLYKKATEMMGQASAPAAPPHGFKVVGRG